ncbi:MAG: PqqD family protein [Acidimicrobiia bacterium]
MATDASAQHFTVPSHVLSRSVGDETVLLDLHQDEYFALSQVGTRVWSLVSDGASFGSIVDAVAESYDVDRGTVEGDVRALIADLVTTGLLHQG